MRFPETIEEVKLFEQDFAFYNLYCYIYPKYPQCRGDLKTKKMENSTPTEFSTRMPQLGETVIFFPNPEDPAARSNGADVCAAIVTRPWSEVCVNLKIVPDHGPMQDRGSVTHFSANPAGYHFMFKDEYEMYLKYGIKDFVHLRRQLLDQAHVMLDDLKQNRERIRQDLDQHVERRKEVEVLIKDVKKAGEFASKTDNPKTS